MLGVCYYPEHWPEDVWDDDARRMAELGIAYVRIGEFAWSRIEPEAGRFEWAWLDRAVETLGRHGLKVVLGTPTGTPPKWLVDRHPTSSRSTHRARSGASAPADITRFRPGPTWRRAGGS